MKELIPGSVRITITITKEEGAEFLRGGDGREAWRTLCAAATVAQCRRETAWGAQFIEPCMANAIIEYGPEEP